MNYPFHTVSWMDTDFVDMNCTCGWFVLDVQKENTNSLMRKHLATHTKEK